MASRARDTDLPSVTPAESKRLSGVPMEVAGVLARKRVRFADVDALRPGDIVELDRHTSEPIEVVVAGRTWAFAELVVVDDENYGLRIVELAAGG
jgi:flagellar motor switch protein FliN/FliY